MILYWKVIIMKQYNLIMFPHNDAYPIQENYLDCQLIEMTFAEGGSFM